MIEHNKEFELAFEFVNGTDKNIFLSGKAGTGKTTFLKELRKHSHRKMIVIAPTGVAAINAGGKTIHSVFPIPREPILSTKIALLDNLRFTSNNRDLLRSLELIVFDEASMIRADVLDAVDYLLRKIRQNNKPFGGIQILFIGDIYQLSPIAKPKDLPFLETEYASPFLIDSKVFREIEIVYIELKKIYRQTDGKFLELLESIRTATCSSKQLAALNELYHEDTSSHSGWITLTTHTKLADKINEENLNQLVGDEVTMTAAIDGVFEQNLYPVAKDLKIKIGAQVMLLRNDSGEDRKYFNGKIGRITNITPNKIRVEFAENDQIELQKEVWVNANYQLDEVRERISTETLGTFEQFPIKLAWAITIHKSQGLTFDCAVIDAGASFTPGQVYVAFSRLTSLQNVWLRSRITESSISVHPVIKRFESIRSNQTDIEQLLKVSKNNYFMQILANAFEWQFLYEYIKIVPPLKADIFSQYDESLGEILKHAINFRKVLLQTVIVELGDLVKLQERITAARVHFEKKITEILNEFRAYVSINKNDINHKRNIPLAQNFIKALNKALSPIIFAEQLIKLIANNVPLGKALISLKNVQPLTVQSDIIVQDQSLNNQKISLLYFREGKSIQEIATIRNLNPQTIEYHLASFIKSGEVNISEMIDPLILEKVSFAARELKDYSLINLKKHFGSMLTLGQIAALREHLI